MTRKPSRTSSAEGGPSPPGPRSLDRIASALEELIRRSRNAQDRHRRMARGGVNPALADLLSDFAESEKVARGHLEQIYRRLGQGAPPGEALGARMTRWVRSRWPWPRGDRSVRNSLRQDEETDRRLERLVQELRGAGADPEALQRLVEIRASLRQRTALYREILGEGRDTSQAARR